MPKLKFSLPSYRRHKFSGQAIVTLNGKDCYLGAWQSDTSKTEYKRLLAEWISDFSKASFSEAPAAFDPSMLEMAIKELAGQLRNLPPDPRLAEIKKAIKLADGTLLKALPKLV
jgi:hypothetical protein